MVYTLLNGICRRITASTLRNMKVIVIARLFSSFLERLPLLYYARQRFLYVGHIMPLFCHSKYPRGYSRSSLRTRNLKKIASIVSVDRWSEEDCIDGGKKDFSERWPSGDSRSFDGL